MPDKDGYRSFDGICLTDTFHLWEDQEEDNESREAFADVFPQNSKRVKAQRKTPLRVIIGNPPYSVGQKSANDNAQNQYYKNLESRIANTYAKEAQAANKNSLYDSYIKAFRGASDKLDKENGGIIGFVTNGNWIDGNAMAGMRKCFEREFSSIYVFNLRGNCRTQGELRRKEAGNVFGLGSRTPIAITILIKKPQYKGDTTIHYHDIGDYLSREEKLKTIKELGETDSPNMKWEILEPNEYGDWINLRSDRFNEFIPIAPDKKFDTRAKSFYVINSMGYGTRRDAWGYNFSKEAVIENMGKMVFNYNECLKNGEINYDPKCISWSSSLINYFERGERVAFQEEKVCVANYRPFCQQRLYFGEKMVHRRGQMPQLFADSNLIICVSGIGVTKDFSCLISNIPIDEEYIGKSQCFPLHWYDDSTADIADLFSTPDSGMDKYVKRDGVSDYILKLCREKYGRKADITKEDIFYYVYGILHSPDYRTAFSADLKKMLPRLPLVDNPDDFRAFCTAGRALANIHLNYETIEPYKGAIVSFAASDGVSYRVEKMRFGKKGKEEDKSTINYNNQITISDIPLEAYDYIVNGKSAIDWIMERYAVTIDSKSGIRNDPNDWAAEHNDEKYILNLLLRIITVSLETNKIVASLPKMNYPGAEPRGILQLVEQ